MVKKIPVGIHGKRAIVDDEDYEWLKQWHWSINAYGYAYHLDYSNGKHNSKFFLMHRLILNAPKGKQVDHIDGNRLNNTRGNIRIATRKQNLLNRGKTIKNKSGFKGVYWDSRQKRWNANLNYNGKSIYLGCSKHVLEAAYIVNKAISKHHKKFAHLNKFTPEQEKELKEWLKNKKTQTSKHRGVSWNEQRKQWHSYININKKRTHLGYFKTEKEAIRARQSYELPAE